MKGSSSLTKKIYNQLKEQILCLQIEPGTALTEKELAVIFNSSKTPVREALNLLATDNLVYVIPHKGYCVTEISYKDLVKLFQYREILESAAVECIMEYGTKKQIEKLELLAMQEPEPFDEKKINTACSRANDAFHFYLISTSENELLIEAHKKTMDQLERVILRDTNEKRIHSIKDEHMKLVELIKEGDTETAREYMKNHIRQTFERVIRSI